MIKPRHALVLVPLVAACGPNDSNSQCASILPGDLVITEIFGDYAAPAGQSSGDTGKEWFEVYNASSAPIDMTGLTVTHSRPDGTMAKTHTMKTLTVQPGAYVVLGDVDPQFVTGFLSYGYGADLGAFFNTNGGKVALGCGSTEIDHAVYGDFTSGQSRTYDGGGAPDPQGNDDLTRWCDTPIDPAYLFEDSNYGTPGAANYDCPGNVGGMCDDNGTLRLPVAPVVGDLAITEVMPDPNAVADTAGEWLEVYAVNPVDLNGLQVSPIGASSVSTIDANQCLHLDAGQYAVIARNADMATNGGLPMVTGTETFTMGNSSGSVQIAFAGTTLDSFMWTNAPTGKSIQLDAAITDPTGNDDPAQWCPAKTAYGAGDLGTPGAANDSCATTCLDTGTNQMRPIVSPTTGQLRISEWMPDPKQVADTAGEWFEVKASADVDLNGLQAGTTTLGATPIVPVAGNCVHLAAGSYALLARSSDNTMNGGLPAVTGTENLTLTNTSGMIQIGVAGQVLDMRSYASVTTGVSIQVDDAGMQCNAPAGTAMYNTMDVGTPGAAPFANCP